MWIGFTLPSIPVSGIVQSIFYYTFLLTGIYHCSTENSFSFEKRGEDKKGYGMECVGDVFGGAWNLFYSERAKWKLRIFLYVTLKILNICAFLTFRKHENTPLSYLLLKQVAPSQSWNPWPQWVGTFSHSALSRVMSPCRTLIGLCVILQEQHGFYLPHKKYQMWKMYLAYVNECAVLQQLGFWNGSTVFSLKLPVIDQ